MAALDERLARLATLSPADLRTEWQRLHGEPPPRYSPDLLRMGLAYALQVETYGKLPARYARRLNKAAASRGRGCPTLSPGTQLVRSWSGRFICVTVLEDGFEWQDRVYTSLTAIAREVTGAGWSGPRFFGLTSHG